MTDPYSFDEKPKRKNSDDPTTWAQAWQAVVVFVAIAAVAAIIVNLVQNYFLGEKIKNYMELMLSFSNGANPAINMMSNFDMTSPLYMLIGIALGSIFWIIGLFFINGLGHFFATKLGGIGTLPGLIVRSRNWMIGSYIIFIIGGMIANYFLVTNVVEYFQALSLESSVITQEANLYLTSQLMPTYLVYGAVWIVWSLGMSNIIGNYYQLGMSRGCGAVIFLNLSFFAAYCAFSMVIGFAILAFVR